MQKKKKKKRRKKGDGLGPSDFLGSPFQFLMVLGRNEYTAGTGFCSMAARAAGCVFIVDVGVVFGACS